MEPKEEPTLGGMMDGIAPIPPAADVDENKKPDEPSEEDKKKAEEFEKNPAVIELRKKITDLEKDKDNYGNNLSGAGKKIKTLEKELNALKNGGGTTGTFDEGKVELPYKNIKRSKDLSKDDREDMTPREIEQMDTIADMQERENKKAIEDAKAKHATTTAAAAAAAKDDDDDEGDGTKKPEPGVVEQFGEEGAVKDLNKEAKDEAWRLSGGDTTIANAIIKEFNEFGGNDKLSKTQLAERMEKAAKLVPNYKPIKEQPSHRGGKPPAESAKKDDPFGTDAIVETVTKTKKTYTL